MNQLKNMKETLITATQAQLANLQNANTEELGKAIDMIKDLAEAIYYCDIVKAMETATEEQKSQNNGQQMYSYLPYYPERDMDREMNRMYYPNSTQTSNSSTGDMNRSNRQTTSSNSSRNFQEFEYYPNPYSGRSPERRRTYMESRSAGDKAAGMKELEAYVQELTSDIIEMMQDATAEERQMLARKLTVLSNKVQNA